VRGSYLLSAIAGNEPKEVWGWTGGRKLIFILRRMVEMGLERERGAETHESATINWEGYAPGLGENARVYITGGRWEGVRSGGGVKKS